MTSIREEITAAICEVIHHQPSPDNDRRHCAHSTKCADEILRVIGQHLTERIRSGISSTDPLRSMRSQGWDECRATVLEILGIEDTVLGPDTQEATT